MECFTIVTYNSTEWKRELRGITSMIAPGDLVETKTVITYNPGMSEMLFVTTVLFKKGGEK